MARSLRPSQLVSRMAGVTVARGREPYFPRAITPDLGRPGTAPECFPIILVDGFPVRRSRRLGDRGAAQDWFDNLVPPADLIAAIETYPSGGVVPAQWRTTENDCGAIAIWTRR